MEFAKIFNSAKYGQILLLAGSENDDCKPEIRAYAQPENLGVCSSSLVFSDTDQGWGTRDEAFLKVDVAAAESIVKPMFDAANEITP